MYRPGLGFFIRRWRSLPRLTSARPHVDLEQLSASAASGQQDTILPPVILPPGIQSPSASDADNSFAGVRAVDCPMRIRMEGAFRVIAKMTATASMLGVCSAALYGQTITGFFPDRREFGADDERHGGRRHQMRLRTQVSEPVVDE